MALGRGEIHPRIEPALSRAETVAASSAAGGYDLRIDEVRLDGFSPESRHIFGEALRTHLAALLADPEFRSGEARSIAPTRPLHVDAAADDPAEVARGVAEALKEMLRP
jgi:hypothetical protein